MNPATCFLVQNLVVHLFPPYLIRFTLVHFVFIPQGKENFKFRDILNWHGLLLLFISSIQVPHIQV